MRFYSSQTAIKEIVITKVIFSEQKCFEDFFYYLAYTIIDVQISVLYNRSTENCTKRRSFMLAVNYTTLRENMKTYMDKITDDYETMIVTRKDNKNIVMLSEESYNNMMENIYVMGNKSNYDWLMESKAQLEKGMVSVQELTEVGADE